MSNDMWTKHVQEMKEAILSDNNIDPSLKSLNRKKMKVSVGLKIPNTNALLLF